MVRSILLVRVRVTNFSSEDKKGLKAVIESIDNRADLNHFMTNYAIAHEGSSNRIRRDGPREEGYVRLQQLIAASHLPTP